ncbi:MAG: hypothetical protein SF051_04505 [Elusimicrobiota bacterium]|nr:hypothetical protein [Elusimicrobiota bacterium]
MEETEPQEAPNEIELPSGLELTPESASTITRSRLSRIIVLAGASESGKTTMLTAIYEKFCRGTFAGLRFAGSDTLWAWEQICHPLRKSSGRSSPKTERTKRTDEQPLLHLRLQSELAVDQTVDVLMTDISGERFEAAIESTDECKKLTLVRRADHFIVCLDGERLCNDRLRHNVRAEGRATLRVFIEAGMLDKASSVMVLFTKADLLRKTPNVDSLISEIEAEYTDKFQSAVGALRFQAVAAYPFQTAIGVDDLIRRWTSETRVGRHVEEVPETSTVGERQMDRFRDTLTNGH